MLKAVSAVMSDLQVLEAQLDGLITVQAQGCVISASITRHNVISKTDLVR